MRASAAVFFTFLTPRPMTKSYLKSSREQKFKNEEMKSPRSSTLGFIRQFARAYVPLVGSSAVTFIAN